jgi:hypothetical protein
MPVKPLSEVQELVELTLFHSIRKTVVDNQYCPDIMNYPNTSAGSTQYWADFEAITLAKGFSIEVFNNSNPDRKGAKKLPRMVMISEGYMPGEVGGDQSRFYKPIAGNQFQVLQRPPQVVDLSFKVHLVCETAMQYRICTSILANAIPTRGYIPIYQPFGSFTPCNLYIQNISYFSVPALGDSILEYVFGYVVKDVWLEEYATLLGTVPALKEIHLQLKQEQQLLADLIIP